MLTSEQEQILRFLRRRLMAPLTDLARGCLPGAPAELIKRALADLEWLGYIVVFYDGAGEPITVQTTDRGRVAL